MANERRLVDVSKENVKAVLEKYQYYPDEIWKFTAMTERFPTVDAVEVVRCRDCKYYYDYGVNRDYCCNRSKYGKQVFDVKFKADDFCSYGERKDCDGNG